VTFKVTHFLQDFSNWIFCRVNQAMGYAIQHIPVPVPNQDKLGGLQQEGHLA